MSLARPSLYLAIILSLTNLRASGAERIDLSPQIEGDSLTHVTIQLDVGGSNVVKTESDDKSGDEKATEKKLPISVAAKVAYDERRLTDNNAPGESGAIVAVRYYDTAEAVIKVADAGRTPTLTDDRRLIALSQAEDRPTIFCPAAPLSREQLDLIDLVGDSFSVDRLLPAKLVAEGDSWANDSKAMGPLLTLDTVAVCEVQSVLDGFNANYAKVRLEGTVQGTADGAATQLDVRGVYLYDRRLHRVTRLNLAVRENRSIGGATPGLDAVAKLQIVIAPLETSAKLDDATVAKIKDQNLVPPRALEFESPTLGFRVKHDRQWYVTAEAREAITLRRVDGSELAAQCTLTSLPSKSEGRQTTLEQFQKDVTYSLGKSFGELVSSREWQNSAGLHCYELVVRGLVEEVPVEWHYYLLAPESGRRMAVTVTIEKAMVDRLANTDRELVESLQLFPPVPATQTAARPTGESAR